MADSRTPSRSVVRFAWRVVGLVLGLVLIAWGVHEIEWRTQIGPAREAWSALIEDMRRSGEPTSLDDLASDVPAGTTEYSAWLREFEAAAGPSVFGVSVQRAAWADPSVMAVAGHLPYVATSAATALPGTEDSWDSWERFQARGSKWTDLVAEDGVLTSLRGLREDQAKLFDQLAEVDAVGGVDAKSWLESMLPSGDLRGGSLLTAVTAAKMMALEAFLASTAGDDVALEQAVRRLLHLAALAEAAPMLIQNISFNLVVEWLLVVVDGSGEKLSPEFVSQELEPALAALGPCASLVRDMRAEPLLVITWIGTVEDPTAPRGASASPLAGHLDFAALRLLQGALEAQREIAAAFTMPYTRGRPAVDAIAARIASSGRRVLAPLPPHMGFSVGSGSLGAVPAQAYVTRYEEACKLELRVLFTRIRLQALAGDVENTGAFASRLSDPYDGNSLRQRLEPDGILRVWSVGPDGIDQTSSGAAGSDDVELVLERRD